MVLFSQLLNLLMAVLFPGGYLYSQVEQRLSHRFTSADPRALSQLAEAERLFAERCYGRAGELFRKLADNTTNAACLSEHARFMQAESLRMQGLYPKAVDTYQLLLFDFPTGAHRRESCNHVFAIAMHWLDDFRDEQLPRENRAPHLRVFGDPRRPLFRQERRALEALEFAFASDPFGAHAEEALYWCGYVNFVRGKFNEADRLFTYLVETYTNSRYNPMVMPLLLQARSKYTPKPR